MSAFPQPLFRSDRCDCRAERERILQSRGRDPFAAKSCPSHTTALAKVYADFVQCQASACFCARGHPPGSMQVATSQPSTDACRPASFPPARYAPDAGCASAGWTRGRPVFSAVTYRLILGVDPLIGARSGSREGTFPWSSQQM